MTHTHMFQWNIPADNQFSERTDRYLNIIATWNTEHYYSDGKPLVFIALVNPTINDCIMVKDWYLAQSQIKEVATNHFANLARQERINKARAELIAAGEIVENPILIRYEQNVISELPY